MSQTNLQDNQDNSNPSINITKKGSVRMKKGKDSDSPGTLKNSTDKKLDKNDKNEKKDVERKPSFFSKMLKFGSGSQNKKEPQKPKKPEIVIIKSLDDFPPAEKKEFVGLDEELILKEIELVCGILSFLGKCRYMTPTKYENHLKKKEELKELWRKKKRLQKAAENQLASASNGDTTVGRDSVSDQTKDPEKRSGSVGGSDPPAEEEVPVEDEEINEEELEEDEEEARIDQDTNDSPYSIKNLMIAGEKELIPQNPKKHFKVLDHSGKGGFGSVDQVKDKKNKVVAMKTMEHNVPKRKRSNLKEVGALKLLAHPNIVEYYSSYLWNNELSVIMEFLEGGTLTEAVKLFTFEESQIAYVAREMLKALDFLHEKQLIHRDLKSANVMMSVTGEIKIIDFGLLSESVTGKQRRCGGSPYWMSPEMIRMVGYDTKNDIWSFAVCILELGKIYNSGSNFKVMFTVATSGWKDPFLDPNHERWSADFQNFIGHCLALNPEERWTSKQLLEHPFIGKAAEKTAMKTILTSVFIHNALKFFS